MFELHFYEFSHYWMCHFVSFLSIQALAVSSSTNRLFTAKHSRLFYKRKSMICVMNVLFAFYAKYRIHNLHMIAFDWLALITFQYRISQKWVNSIHSILTHECTFRPWQIFVYPHTNRVCAWTLLMLTTKHISVTNNR